MNLAKRIFITVYGVLIAFLVVEGASGLAGSRLATTILAWSGVLLTGLVPGSFFAYVFLAKPARTDRLLGHMLIGITCAFSLTIIDSRTVWWGLDGLAGWLVYLLWYSKLDRPEPAFRVGDPLPAFALERPDGSAVTSAELMTSPALFMFYRGNWCPLCIAQIREIAAQYREIVDRGVRIVLVSPQKAPKTAALARRFDAPLEFLVDPDNRAARALGIAHENGVPLGMEVLGYASETVLPTVIITGADSTVLWTHLTDNYRVRPEPATFLRALSDNGIG